MIKTKLRFPDKGNRVQCKLKIVNVYSAQHKRPKNDKYKFVNKIILIYKIISKLQRNIF